MTILEKLSNENIVSFDLNSTKDTIHITECCDLWYSTALSKKEVKQMIDELRLLHKQMVDLKQ